MRRTLLTLFVVATVVLSGCSALDGGDGGDGGITESASFPAGGVAGDQVSVEVTVDTVGDAAGESALELRVDGETVDSASVSLDPGESQTVTLTHTFESAGEYDLAVAGEETTLTVYETPRAYVSAAMDDVETERYVENATLDGQAVVDGQARPFHQESSTTARKNLTAETMYEREEQTTEFLGETTEQTTETWVVDGTRYVREVDEDSGETTYTSGPAAEFDDGDSDFSAEALTEYLSTERTDDRYVFTFEAESSAEATDLWAAIDENEEIPATAVSSVSLEYRADRRTGRLTEARFEVTLADYQAFSTLDITIRQNVTAYDEPVAVAVPDEVRENA